MAPPAPQQKLSERPAAEEAKKIEIPKDQSTAAQIASPVATASSQLDPMPHYVMAGACAAGSALAYTRLSNQRAAAIAGGFSVAYLLAGRMLAMGHEKLGYDMGSITSIALTAMAYPQAKAMGDAYSVTMTALGGVSSIANVIKSYQVRTGRPHEMQERKQ